MKGYIHSFESFGTVDGPGVRFVVFFQGCPMRCLYCHNPDTWQIKDGKEMDTDEIIERFQRNRTFYETGGITATGGEPLLQIDFLIDLFQKAKEKNIHTCLDTSGIVFDVNNEALLEKMKQLAQVTDLVMLDIKHMDAGEHKKLTTHSNEAVFAFAKFLEEEKVDLWIRHVLVPGITDKEEELKSLGRYLNTLSNFKHLEILPYHTMGIVKYEKLGIPYPLKDTPSMSKERAEWAKEIVFSQMDSNQIDNIK